MAGPVSQAKQNPQIVPNLPLLPSPQGNTPFWSYSDSSQVYAFSNEALRTPGNGPPSAAPTRPSLSPAILGARNVSSHPDPWDSEKNRVLPCE